MESYQEVLISFSIAIHIICAISAYVLITETPDSKLKENLNKAKS